MVAECRAKMNKFFMRISNLGVNECRSAMLILNMDISHIMVHAEKIEQQKLKQVGKGLKRTRAEDGNPRLDLRFKISQVQEEVLQPRSS